MLVKEMVDAEISKLGMINLKSKIYVAGHKGLVGSAIVRKLKKKGYKNIIFRSKKQLDLKKSKKSL